MAHQINLNSFRETITSNSQKVTSRFGPEAY